MSFNWKLFNLVWSLLMGMNALVWTFERDWQQVSFYLLNGAIAYAGYEVHR